MSRSHTHTRSHSVISDPHLSSMLTVHCYSVISGLFNKLLKRLKLYLILNETVFGLTLNPFRVAVENLPEWPRVDKLVFIS